MFGSDSLPHQRKGELDLNFENPRTFVGAGKVECNFDASSVIFVSVCP